ncbi:MAG TPA: GNAT family N-acetyltransferase [Chitinophagaceae bacterium]|jgi:predicted GNAT family acetyltransferase|nr:GNAT family N-acetyltransferase [Chitinophagaceae bacterium]
MMHTTLHDDGKKGRWLAYDGNKEVGLMDFVYAGTDKFIIEHTEVYEGNEGKGYGKALVQAAVDFAREKHLKIMPLCPYAKAVFDKTPAYADVLW